MYSTQQPRSAAHLKGWLIVNPIPVVWKLLAREQHRCVFTDKVHLRSIARGDVGLGAPGRSRWQGGHLEAAHIVSQLLPDYTGMEAIGGMTQAAQDKVSSFLRLGARTISMGPEWEGISI